MTPRFALAPRMPAAAEPGHPGAPALADRDVTRRPPLRHLPWRVVLLACAVVAGVVLRCFDGAGVWLDEAITISIARLPLHAIPAALRHDGAPPLYYFLLHGWFALFGSSALAARALSGVVSLLCLPVLWRLTRQLGAGPGARAAVVLFATSPFAILFATEARMYALVMLLTLLAVLAVVRALERPSWPRLAAVAVSTAALLLTHYWAVFLLVAAGGWLLLRGRRPRDRRTAVLVLGALGAGCALFAPWLPDFLFQLRHTGTPWAPRPSLTLPADVLAQWSLGAQEPKAVPHSLALWTDVRILELALAGLVLLAVFGGPLDRFRVVLDLRGRPVARDLAAVCFGSLGLAAVVSLALHSGYESRYSAPMFVLLPLLGGLGVAALPCRFRGAALGLVAVTGLLASPNVLAPQHKTQAPQLAAALRRQGRPGDVVTYCPDQLAPAVTRLLPSTLRDEPFPNVRNVARVDWVDYAARNEHASVPRFAAMLLAQSHGHDLFAVEQPGYATFGHDCERLVTTLARARGGARLLLPAGRQYYERANLYEMRRA